MAGPGRSLRHGAWHSTPAAAARIHGRQERSLAALAKRHGLRLADVADVADWAFADVLFEGAWDQTASMDKAYQNGFTETVDTGSMLLDILQQYRELKLLP